MSDKQDGDPNRRAPSRTSRCCVAFGCGCDIVAGVILAIVFSLSVFTASSTKSTTPICAAPFKLLKSPLLPFGLVLPLWGWYLVKDGMERANTNRRLTAQASSLRRITKE